MEHLGARFTCHFFALLPAGLLFHPLLGAGAPRPVTARPNGILVFIDELGYGDLQHRTGSQVRPAGKEEKNQ